MRDPASGFGVSWDAGEVLFAVVFTDGTFAAAPRFLVRRLLLRNSTGPEKEQLFKSTTK